MSGAQVPGFAEHAECVRWMAMEVPGMSATSKRRTNVSIDAGLLEAARELGLNVSSITEAALADFLARREAIVALL